MVSDKDNKKVYLINTLSEEALDEEIKRLRLLIKDAETIRGGNEHEFQNRK